MPIKQEVVLDPEELLREAEEQAGDDGGEQVVPSFLESRCTSMLMPQRHIITGCMSEMELLSAGPAGCQGPQAPHPLL